MMMLARLILIAVVAILPALGINAYNAYELRQTRVEEMKRQAFYHLQSVARELDRLIDGVQANMALVVSARELHQTNPDDCARYLESVTVRGRVFSSLSLTDITGRVICSNISPSPIGNNLSDRAAFQFAIARSSFAVGSMVIGRGNGRRQLNMAHVVKNEAGEVTGVLTGGIDIDWLNREFANVPLNTEGSLTIADRFGNILVRYPESNLIGEMMRPEMLWTLKEAKGAVVEIQGRDGKQRFSAYSPPAERSSELLIAASLGRFETMAPIEEATRRGFVLALTGLLLAALAAVLVGRRFIARPVSLLLSATEKWRTGDRDARVETQGMPSEFASIGNAFNNLVSAVDSNERALRRSVQEMRSIYDSSPVGLAVLDRDLRYLNANASISSMNCIRPVEPGLHLSDTVPHMLDVLVPLFTRVFETGEPIQNEEVTQDGRSWISNYYPVTADDGEVIAVSCAVLETTALNRATDELARTEAWMKLAQESAGIGTWDWDLATGQLRWSLQQFALHGLPPHPDGLSVREWYDCVKADDRSAMDVAIGVAITQKDRYDVDYRILDATSGETRWIATRGRVILNPQGQPVRLTGVSFDTSERHRAEELLERANADLEQRVAQRTDELVREVQRRERAQAQLLQSQKNEALGQLTGGIAHDFNNLLSAILSSLSLLKKRLPQDERLQRYLDNAWRGAERGASLTQRMLAFARKQDLKPQTVDVEELLRGMSDLLQSSIGPQIRIEMRFAPRLPAIEVDPHQLELAILNLAVNARDAMPDGGELTIVGDEQIYQGQSFVRLQVRDSGTGMDEVTAQRAIEPFFTTKEIGKGTGLGLSMVQGLVAQSGGRIHIKTALGQGTNVELWLPLAQAGAISPPKAQQDLGRAQAPSLRVLIVDDDPLVLMGTADLVEDLGHQVRQAPSAADALALLESEDFDVVLSDQAMPGMTGVELAEEIARRQPDLPVILTTGYADISQSTSLTLRRLSKPFSQKDLDLVLRDILTQSSKVVALRPRNLTT